MVDATLEGDLLAPPQRHLWHLQDGERVLRGQCLVVLEGAIHGPRLRQTLEEIVGRHSILRTTFRSLAGMALPLQVVSDRIAIQWRELEAGPFEGLDPQGQLEKLFQEEKEAAFDLAEGPILRVGLLRVAPEKSLLCLTLPSLCGDFWTLKNIVRTMLKAYGSFSNEPDEEVLQYRDIAGWMNEFLEEEEGAESQLRATPLRELSASPLLPGEQRPSRRESFRPEMVRVEIPREVLRGLERIEGRYGVSRASILLACWHTLLWRWTGEEVAIATVFDGREYEEMLSALGLYARSLPITCRFGEDMTLLDAIRQTEARLREAEEGQYSVLPESDIEEVKEDGIPEVRRLGFEWAEGFEERSIGGIFFSIEQHYSHIEPFGLKLTCRLDRGELFAEFHYDPEGHRADGVRRIAHSYRALLNAGSKNEVKEVGQLDLLGSAKRHQLLWEFNDTRAERRRVSCVHRQFERQAEIQAERVALVYGEQQITYGELNARANQLAHYLRRSGVGPEVVVAVCAARSVHMILAVLGILKAGGAYLPLEPDLPEERLRYLCLQSGATVLLAQAYLAESLPSGLTPHRVLLDREWGEISREEDQNPWSGVTLGNLAYLLFTSGSTGRPKGVAVEHRHLAKYLLSSQEALRGLETGLRFSLVTTFAADLSNTAIFGTLCRGGCLDVASYDQVTSASSFARYLEERRIEVLKIVPSHLKALLASGIPMRPLLGRLIVGGEACDPDLVRRVQEVMPGCLLLNEYGPTETTVGVTVEVINPLDGKPSAAAVPIGRPLAHSEIYLLDRRGQPVPIAVVGEPMIGGAIVTRGYLGNPGLTAGSFVPHPFSDTPGQRLYRSGDLARWLGDGRLDFVGRNDSQVKIRGFRVELGEIESVLCQLPEVREAAVLFRRGETSEDRLVAYIVRAGKREHSPRDLREVLRKELPEHMVPSVFEILESLPLTANGKVDRRALPEPEESGARPGADFVPPKTSTEAVLADLWAELLGFERIGSKDDFFASGGHSLLAVQLMSRIRKVFGIELSLESILKTPVLEDLAASIEDRLAEAEIRPRLPEILPLPQGARAPLSFSQQRLWFLDKLEPLSTAYHLPFALRLTGELDVPVLSRALNEIIRRQHSLRTIFPTVEGEVAAVLCPASEAPIPVVDLGHLPVGEREAAAHHRVAVEGSRPFDLEGGPLLRVNLLRLTPADHVLLLVMHHIAADRWSLDLLMHETTTLYGAFVQGKSSPLKNLEIQYSDYAHWQRSWLTGSHLEGLLEHWRERLAGAPALLELPTDRPRPPVQTYRGSAVSLELPESFSEALRALSVERHLTLFMTLLAAFYALLYRLSGSDDLSIGVPISGRNRVEVEPLIGLFLNTIVLRCEISGDLEGGELLERVRAVTLEAHLYQDLPFEKLVEELRPVRDLSHTPLFQVMFSMQQAAAEGALSLPGLEIAPLLGAPEAAQFDLTLSTIETPRGRIHFDLDYSTDLFDQTTMHRMLRHFSALLQGIVNHPDLGLAHLSVLSSAEEHQLSIELNATDTPVSVKGIHGLFEEQVRRIPEAVAILCGEEHLSYGRLDRQANRLAQRLVESGAGIEVPVGICLERSPRMVITLFAVLKTGGNYVPLDPSYPRKRLAFMVEHSKIRVLVSERDLAADLPLDRVRRISLDRELEGVGLDGEYRGRQLPSLQNRAYTIFTSGSSGLPKGVQIHHGAVVNFLESMGRRPGLDSTSRLLSVTSLSFDIAALELFLPLLIGARLEIVSRELAADGPRLLERLRTSGTTVMQATPSTWQMLCEAGWEQPLGIDVLCGGEALPKNLAARLLERCRSLWNLYGPTETTIWSAVERVDTVGDGVIFLGRPIANTEIHVVDRHLLPTPIGVAGELCIGGRGLARGYLGRPGLTADRFIPNPFSTRPGRRLYRTGDLARVWPDGKLGYLGRIDHQVKLRGFRIELQEIEAVLAQHAAVREAVVTLRRGPLGNDRLVAYLTTEEVLAPATLRDFLKSQLPEHMVPSLFSILETLPLTPNGKIDRRALPEPEQGRKVRDYLPPGNGVEIQLTVIWQELLEIYPIGVTENFFELGGHSILGVRLMARIHRQFGQEIELASLFRAPTIEAQAKLLKKGGEGASWSPLVAIQPNGSRPPVFCVHPMGGHVLCYVALTHHLDSEQPVYGLQAPSLDDVGEHHAAIEEMAKGYVEAIRGIQPQGPYRLVGYSYGGVIAFEMAQQLRRQGEEITLLGLLDTSRPVNIELRPSDYTAEMVGLVREYGEINGQVLDITASDLAGLDREEQLRFILKRLREEDLVAPEIDLVWMRRLMHGHIARRRAALSYVARPYPGRITLLRAETDTDFLEDLSKEARAYLEDRALGWDALALEGVEIYELSAQHGALILEPHVQEVARRLDQCLARSMTSSRNQTSPSRSDAPWSR